LPFRLSAVEAQHKGKIMAISDALGIAHENLLRVIPRPLTAEEEDERVRWSRPAPNIDAARLHNATRCFVEALSRDPAAAKELQRRGTLCAMLTGEGSNYLTAKTAAHKALRRWRGVKARHGWKSDEHALRHAAVDRLVHEGGRFLVCWLREECNRLDGVLAVSSGVPKGLRALLQAWRDEASSIADAGENDCLDGCYWLLHPEYLAPLNIPDAAPTVRQAADALVRWCDAQPAAEAIPKGQGGDTDQAPVEYLMSWREILDALHLTNDEEHRGMVRRLNGEHAGPIIIPRQGSQPKVITAKLVEWWNGLEGRFRELQQRRTDREATAAEQFSYGKDGTVAPGISGGVKKRRKDRKG
jgi:hypothetical protein